MSNNYYTQEQIDALGQFIGSQLKDATNTINIKRVVESIPGYSLMSDAEKEKLLSLESSKFLGTFPNSEDIPKEKAVAGSYADVESEDGTSVDRWIYNLNSGEFVKSTSSSGVETSSSIKTKYESNDDTNAFTDAFKSILENLPENIQVAENTQTFSSKLQDSLNYIDFSKLTPNYYNNATISNYNFENSWDTNTQLNFSVEIDGVVYNEEKSDLLTLDNPELTDKLNFRITEISEVVTDPFGFSNDTLIPVLEVSPKPDDQSNGSVYEVILRPSQNQKKFSKKSFSDQVYINPVGDIAFKLSYGNFS